MKYKIFKQERESWCLPACLQSILSLRRYYEPSQSEIAEKLGIKEEGIEDFSLLEKFLAEYDLKYKHNNPLTSMIGADIFLEEELDYSKDIIAAYDYAKLFRTGKKDSRHYSVITEYNIKKDIVKLGEPSEARIREVILPDLVDSMQAREDSRFGFYVIESE
jgi:hypothetical protein